MLTAEARVATDRAGRYLAQLCRHVDRIPGRGAGTGPRVEWSDTDGVITVGRSGRCILRAAEDALAALATLVVALHLGAGGAVLAASGWTGWAANIVLAVVVIKLIVVVGHLAARRRRG